MGVLLGAMSSLVLGVADFFGGRATQKADGFAVVFFASFVAIPLAIVAATLFEGALGWNGLGYGLLAGVGTGIGLGSLYRGFAAASTGIVAPLASVVSAIVPVGWDVLSGTRLPGLAIAGICIGLGALVLTTWSPDLAGRIGAGLMFGLLAGLGVGFGLAVLGNTTTDDGLWPVVGQRLTVLVVTGLTAAIATRAAPLPVREVRPAAIASGLLSTVGVVCFVAGTQRGDLAAVAVAGSQFPAVTVALTALLDGESLRWWQVIGLGFAILGVCLIALA